MKYLIPRNAFLGVLGATAALAAAALVHGDDSGSGATTTTTQFNPASSGMVAAKDEATGALRAPTAEEIAALRSAGSAGAKVTKAKAEPVVRQLPNGALAITLDQSFEVYSIASKGPDGKVRTACVPAEKVDAVLQAAQKGDLTQKEVLDEK